LGRGDYLNQTGKNDKRILLVISKYFSLAIFLAMILSNSDKKVYWFLIPIIQHLPHDGSLYERLVLLEPEKKIRTS